MKTRPGNTPPWRIGRRSRPRVTGVRPDSAFAALGDERFVSLTTFRRSGQPVSTPVWVARDGDALIVTTPRESGKVKRLRNSPRVELRPCSRMGRVDEEDPPIAGTAEIIKEVAPRRQTGLIRRKYGLEYRVVMGIERLVRSAPSERVILRISGVTRQPPTSPLPRPEVTTRAEMADA